VVGSWTVVVSRAKTATYHKLSFIGAASGGVVSVVSEFSVFIFSKSFLYIIEILKVL